MEPRPVGGGDPDESQLPRAIPDGFHLPKLRSILGVELDSVFPTLDIPSVQ